MVTSREQKFIRLAERRVNMLLNNIRLIKQLSNKNNYEYSDDHVKKIFTTLKSAIDDANESFYAKEKKRKIFKL
jgi:hypothetical protein